MRRTRFMGWFFLALSVAFFCLQDFRWALQTSQGMFELLSGGRRFTGILGIDRGPLESLRTSAQQNGNAEQLAFLALHWPREERDQVMRFADQAVAKDPKLVWIYYQIAGIYRTVWRSDAAVARQVEEKMAKVEASDRDNALPYLWRAEFIRERAKDWPKGSGVAIPGQGDVYWDSLAAQTEWRAAMTSAFAQPRYDSYAVKRFDLERRVLNQQGWATPVRMILSVASYEIPNLLNVREYAQFTVKQLAAESEKAGHADEALRQYLRTSSFGALMRLEGPNLIEQLIGMAVERIGLEPQVGALKKAGRPEEARLVELRLLDIKRGGRVAPRQEPMLRSSAYYWSGLLLNFMVFQVILFGALTLLAIIYVNAKRWIRPEKRGLIFQWVTVAENYLPLLLFFSCLGVYVVYAPYAYNFRHYMTVTEEIHFLEPFFYNVFPSPWLAPGFLYMPMENAFRDYIVWALLGVAAVAVLAGWEEWWFRQKRV